MKTLDNFWDTIKVQVIKMIKTNMFKLKICY
jgi:hypothetical protein